MNILLLNDNPVVTKLVTLSAQKTSDELEIVGSIDEIAQKPCDLFVLDDALYSDDIISVVKAKTSFSSSLYICSRDAEEVLGFTQTLKKPFLPTDLVELFAKISKEVQSPAPVVQDDFQKEEAEIVEIESEDEFAEEELEPTKEMEVEELEETLEIDGLEDFEFDDELEDIGIDEDLGESVLDKDDVQEVQNLLDEVDVEFTYDVDKVAGELSFSPDALKEFLEDFIAQADEFKAQLYGALDLSDYETIHGVAHKLKGVAANLSVTEAFDSLVVVNQSEDNDEIKVALDRYYVIIAKLNEFIHNPKAETMEESPMIEENSSDTVLDVEELEDFNDEDLEFDELEELEVDEEFEIEEELEVEEELSLKDEVDMPEMELEDEADEVEESIELEEELETEEEVLEEELSLEDEEDTPEMELEDETEEVEDEEELETEEEVLEEELSLEDEEDMPAMELEDETEEVEESIELEEELETEEEVLEEELSLEDEEDVPEMELEDETEEVEESLDLEEDLETEEDLDNDSSEEPNLETQIESAVSELSEDDLASELDADSILDISVDDVEGLDALEGMDSLDALSSADIKSAIGEDDTITDSAEDDNKEIQTFDEEVSQDSENDGVEALKTLLTALSDKNVAASLKGMTININITLGDK